MISANVSGGGSGIRFASVSRARVLPQLIKLLRVAQCRNDQQHGGPHQ